MVNLPLLALALWAGVLHAGREDRTLWADGWQRCWRQTTVNVGDLERFPPEGTAETAVKFLDQRKLWLDNLQGVHPQPCYAPWFEAAYDDVAVRRRVWVELNDCYGWRSMPNVSPWNKTWAMCNDLEALKALLGERDYNAGVMPGLIGADFMGGR